MFPLMGCVSSLMDCIRSFPIDWPSAPLSIVLGCFLLTVRTFLVNRPNLLGYSTSFARVTWRCWPGGVDLEVLYARLWRNRALDLGSVACSALGAPSSTSDAFVAHFLSRFSRKWHIFAVVNDWIEDVERCAKSDLGLCRNASSKRSKSC